MDYNGEMCVCSKKERKSLGKYFDYYFKDGMINNETEFEEWYRREYTRIMGNDCPFSPKYLQDIFKNISNHNNGPITREEFIIMVCYGAKLKN